MHHPSTHVQNWSPLRLALFRFFTVYFVLYGFMNMSAFGPGSLEWIWKVPVTWAGRLLIEPGYTIKVWPNGSGDTTFNYLQLFCQAVIALLISLVWWALDHRRRQYHELRYWLHMALRYMLAGIMLAYGFAKLFKTQFPFPHLAQLDQPLGNSSPMGLAWSFMGYSTAYNIFTGLAEALGGCFLFFRRTQTFGALLCIAVLVNVVAMNFCFDIPVKLFSSHLLVAAIILTVPDLERLYSFFFLNRPVPADNRYYPVFHKRWKRIARVSLKALFIAFLLYNNFDSGIRMQRKYGSARPKPALYGTYLVETFVRNRDTLPPLASDSLRWNRMYIAFDEYAQVKTMNDHAQWYGYTADTVKKTICLRTGSDSALLHYSRPDAGHLAVNGRLFGDSVHILLKRKDEKDYLLVNRGFHWINEYPFNR